ncbi:MAG: transposase, partial [Lachnospiraceae bacterium]|nr:transposase [Lachnospiraceae bacterium]
LYPNKSQIEYLNNCFGCCRFVYNQALKWRILAYQADGTSLNYNDTAFGLTALKKQIAWLRDVDSIALQQALRHLDTAYNNFFTSKRSGFPKFKSKRHSKCSYTTINQGGTISISDNGIKLPKIGIIKASIHRLPDPVWILKSATVSKERDDTYYVSVLFEYTKPATPVCTGAKAIGLDYKSDGLYVDSNGRTGSNHKYYRESHKKLAKEQRRLSRKCGSKKDEPKSNNFIKQCRKVNKIHKHISNQRLDNLHKLSTEIANQYDIVCVENLDMKVISNKGFGNGKATLDNGFGMFLSMLEYKLADRGKLLVRIDKWFPSSQLCSCCGYRNPLIKDLSIRKWECPACHMYHDRDTNAAVNILNEGLRIIATK